MAAAVGGSGEDVLACGLLVVRGMSLFTRQACMEDLKVENMVGHGGVVVPWRILSGVRVKLQNQTQHLHHHKHDIDQGHTRRSTV